MKKKFEEILRKVRKLYNNSYIAVDYELKQYSSDKPVKEVFKLYVESFVFTITGNAVSTDCDSLEGFIHHLNHVFKDDPNWKPITQTAKGKRELKLIKDA